MPPLGHLVGGLLVLAVASLSSASAETVVPQTISVAGSMQDGVDGTYLLSSEEYNGRPEWQKDDGSDRWLYFTDNEYWIIGSAADRARNKGYVCSIGAGAATPMQVLSWQKVDGTGGWKAEASISMSVSHDDLLKAYAALQRQDGELQKARKQQKDTADELHKAQGQLELKEADLQKAKKEHDLLQAELVNSSSRLDQAEAQLRTKDGDLHKAKKERDLLQAELVNSSSRLDQVEAQLRAKDGDLHKAEARLKTTEGDLNKAEAQLKTTEGDLQKADRQVTNTTKELHEAERDDKSLSARLANASSRLEQAERDDNSLSARLANASSRLEQAKRLAKAEGAELEEARKENATLQEDLRSAKSDLEEAYKRGEETTSKLQKAERDDKSLSARLANASSRLEQAKRLAKDQGAELEEARKENATLQEDLRSAKSDLEEAYEQGEETTSKLQKARILGLLLLCACFALVLAVTCLRGLLDRSTSKSRVDRQSLQEAFLEDGKGPPPFVEGEEGFLQRLEWAGRLSGELWEQVDAVRKTLALSVEKPQEPPLLLPIASAAARTPRSPGRPAT